MISVRSYFTKGHERSLRAKKQIVLLFFIRAASIASAFLLVPITIDFLDPRRYGIWLTLSSILAWISIFDFGFGMGLRNRLAESLAKNDVASSRSLVSTTYLLSIGVVLTIGPIFLLSMNWLDWQSILGDRSIPDDEIKMLVIAVMFFVLLQFIFRNLGFILLADQKPAAEGLLALISSLCSLAAIWFLKGYLEGRLIELGMIMSLTPVLVYLLASFVLFRGYYSRIKPSVTSIDRRLVRSLMSLSLRFFILQLSALVIFTTDNLIITQLFGPEEVAPYQISYKYLSVGSLVFAIALSPFWSATTEAWAKKDTAWLRNAMKRSMQLWMLVSAGTVVMVIASHPVYQLWIGDRLQIPFVLTVTMAAYHSLMSFTMPYIHFINGIGKLKIQLYHAVIVGLINIPLSVYLAKYCELGVVGVIVATCIGQTAAAIWAPLQYSKLINGTARGVWNR